MFSSLKMFTAALVVLTVASGPDIVAARASSRRSRLVTRQTESSAYTLAEDHSGKNFLSGFKFFTGDDPTHGQVNYLGAEDAKQKGLVIEGDETIIKVDDKTELPPGAKRDSVRITSVKSYDHGLFIADISQMPYGCSVWPAYWMVGPDWPKGGEIDVVEGVNKDTVNQATFHTTAGCDVQQNSGFEAKLLKTSCGVSGNDNSGCGFKDSDTRSYGKGFNEAGGGVYAHTLDSTGINIWFFSRGEIPEDIKSNNPNPSSWPKPLVKVASESCKIEDHFNDLSLVINTTLCGDWAGATYPGSGCPGTCSDAVKNPENLKNAVWKIKSIRVYQKK